MPYKHKKSRKMTAAGRRFVSMKIRKNIMEGRSPKQAVAIALSQARKRGYKVPRQKMRRR